jgi:hypothetical protein
MNDKPLVSIIINNYNYGRFLRAAIDSALAQSYPRTETLVVDDGSTDDSHAIIASYGARILPILKANGGQASAFNAGFARCNGEIVIFLDADDLLHVDAVAHVAQALCAAPDGVRVQWRLAVVEVAGVATGESKPPQSVPLPGGDLCQPTLLYGDDIPWLPTSGNAFHAAMLRQILPMPEAPYRICADYYLSNLSPLYGRVLTVDQPLGSYRIHGSNNYQETSLDLAKLQALIARTRETHRHLGEHARQPGLIEAAYDEIASLSLTYPANQLICLRLVKAWRADDNASVGALAWRGIRAAWRRGDLSLLLRFMYTVWFVLVGIAPRRAVPWLAEQLFFPEARGKWIEALTPQRWHARRYGLEP